MKIANCKMGGYKLELNMATKTITGKGTYNCKDVLKSKWKCSFDSNTKGWVLKTDADVEMFIDMHCMVVDGQKDITTTVPVKVKVSNSDNGFCHKCNSYCYGDCTAH